MVLPSRKRKWLLDDERRDRKRAVCECSSEEINQALPRVLVDFILEYIPPLPLGTPRRLEILKADVQSILLMFDKIVVVCTFELITYNLKCEELCTLSLNQVLHHDVWLKCFNKMGLVFYGKSITKDVHEREDRFYHVPVHSNGEIGLLQEFFPDLPQDDCVGECAITESHLVIACTEDGGGSIYVYQLDNTLHTPHKCVPWQIIKTPNQILDLAASKDEFMALWQDDDRDVDRLTIWTLDPSKKEFVQTSEITLPVFPAGIMICGSVYFVDDQSLWWADRDGTWGKICDNLWDEPVRRVKWMSQGKGKLLIANLHCASFWLL